MKPKDYQVGRPDAYGNIVKSILVGSDAAVVYTTENGELRWDLDDGGKFPPELEPARRHFSRLMARIKTSGMSSLQKEAAYALLGSVYFQILNDRDPDCEAEAFKGVEEFLDENAPRKT